MILEASEQGIDHRQKNRDAAINPKFDRRETDGVSKRSNGVAMHCGETQASGPIRNQGRAGREAARMIRLIGPDVNIRWFAERVAPKVADLTSSKSNTDHLPAGPESLGSLASTLRSHRLDLLVAGEVVGAVFIGPVDHRRL